MAAKKTTKPRKSTGSASAGRAARDLPLTEKDARQIRGGAADIFAKIGDIKGESLRRR